MYDWVNEDSLLSGMKPGDVVYITLMSIMLVRCFCATIRYAYNNLRPTKIKSSIFRLAAEWIPMVRNEINKEMDKLRQDCVEKYGGFRRATALTHMPEDGMS